MAAYDPLSLEPRWFPYWEEKGYCRPSMQGKPYCIMLPPPNVTGTLHMGHAFQDTIMDALTRYHRMLGDNTLWQPGVDHAGIATQMVVERLLEQQGLKRQDLGREAFLKKVWAWKEQSGGTIVKQMKRLGCSCDWTRLRFTMDEGLSRAVREVFVRLYEEGLIYRGKRLVNWDPVLQTAISDLEVVWEEEEGFLWHIRYPLVDGSGHVVVATTRPETMLGDVAVAVHPADERYRPLIGKKVRLPLVEREIPIIADDYVDPGFGTGVVKITPAHDFHDYEVGKRHRLPQINIFTPDARINDHAPSAYRGLDRFEARSRIVEDLSRLGLLEKVEKHRLSVPRGDRSGAIIEPYLTDQWFVDLTEKGWEKITKPAIEVVKTGRLRFIPENWAKIYFQWLENIQDWCISRQIWWGHRIPAWYDSEGDVYVGRSETEVREKFGLGSLPLRQDEDVLDTWFSSALWPFSTLGWPEKTRLLQTFYPTSVLVTGFDIIFFWVARMVMMGLYFMGEVPFREVYIHGLVRDAHGQKMSKSKGNILDPLDIIEGIDLESLIRKRTFGLMQPQMADRIAKQTRKEFPNGIPAYGADALRFTFASLATTGRNINFDLKRVEGSRHFLNKLWNACRYILMKAEEIDLEGETELGTIDRWIRARLSRTVREVRQALASYRLDFAAQKLYDFLWEEFCDWYLEFSKVALKEESETRRRGTLKTLLEILERYLRLAHPIIPFITEELWQKVAPILGQKGDSIMIQPFPEADVSWEDREAEREIEWLKKAIFETRRIRAQFGISPAKPVKLLLQGGSEEERRWAEKHRLQISQLTKAASITWLGEEEEAPVSAMALAGGLKIYLPLAGLVNREAERKRLSKEIARREKELERTEKKLQNQNFLRRAPQEVVEKEREKLARLRQELEELREQRRTVEAL